MAKIKGECLCGSVSFRAEAEAREAAACHCDMCRRWLSGPYFEINCKNVVFSGEGHIVTYRSSEWAERGFCGRCGSNLFYRIIDSDTFQISVGLLDDVSDISLILQVFSDHAPPYCSLANETETMTAAEVYAAYAPP